MKPDKNTLGRSGGRSARKNFRALIWIDSRPIRNRALKKYQRVRRQLHLAREQIHRFEQIDRPAFQKWLFHQFGPLISDLRENQRALDEKISLMDLVEETAFRERISRARAYQRVMERIHNPRPGDDPTFEEDPGKRGGKHPADPEDEWNDKDDAAFEEAYDQFKQAFESNFGVNLDDLEEEMGFNPSRLPGLGPQRKIRANDSRLKQAYRALVRRLHPDANPDITDEKKRMWHQAQEAMARGDVEMIEALLVLCDLDETDPGPTTPVSLIDRLTLHFSDTLRQMQSSIFRHRRDQAWKFGSRNDRHQLARKLESEMRSQLIVLKARLSEVENRLAVWEQRPNPDVRRVMRKSGGRQKQKRGRKHQFTQAAFKF